MARSFFRVRSRCTRVYEPSRERLSRGGRRKRNYSFEETRDFMASPSRLARHSRVYPVQNIESISVYSINDAWASARGARVSCYTWRKLAEACGKALLDHSSKSLGWNFIAQRGWSMKPYYAQRKPTIDRGNAHASRSESAELCMYSRPLLCPPFMSACGYPTLRRLI